ncbi:MAG: hypothetical protein H6933_09225 [Burkholderiaceae bacterium]|nr:hypothetical protein [Rhodoferax sp.]MCP5285069.1 hypothetical protein [Burkholderiaceae bacterium]
MNLPRPKMRSFWRRRPQAAQVVSTLVDPADMGISFGLELALPPGATAKGAESANADGSPWWDRAEVRKSCGA